MEDADAEALAGSLACGDMIAIYLKIDEASGKIIDAKFESYGCAANIAAASILTEMVKGKSLQDAWKISWKEVSYELGGLPSVKYHCGLLVNTHSANRVFNHLASPCYVFSSRALL